MLIDLGPIAVFVIAFNVLQRIEATRESAVYIATGIFMATRLAAIAYSRINHGRVPPVLIITGVLVVGFGGLTLLLRDRTFIQIKPTFTYLFYTAAILGSVAIRQNVWKLLFGHAFTLPDRIWTILALRWAGFFRFMAVLNEVIRNTQSFEFWLNTRPFLVFPLVLLFAAQHAAGAEARDQDSYIVCDILFTYLFNANSADHVGDTSLESRLYSAVTGEEMNEEESYHRGEMLSVLERALAVRDGRTRQDDILHSIYFEKEDAGGRRYMREDLERSKSDYYRLMGWDIKSGIPTLSTLERLGLKDVAEELGKKL